MAGFLRNALSAHSDDEKLKLKVKSFIALSPIFALAWKNNSVLQPEEIAYTYHHASLGNILLEKQIWWNVDGESSSRLNVYYPSQIVDKNRLAALPVS